MVTRHSRDKKTRASKKYLNIQKKKRKILSHNIQYVLLTIFEFSYAHYIIETLSKHICLL